MAEFNLDDFMTTDNISEIDSLSLSLCDPSIISRQVLVEQQQQQQQQQRQELSTHRLRNYRPRNPRSCDFCRARKTACRVEDDPPCATCKLMGRECTFAERARRRKRQHQRRDLTWQSNTGSAAATTAQESKCVS